MNELIFGFQASNDLFLAEDSMLLGCSNTCITMFPSNNNCYNISCLITITFQN